MPKCISASSLDYRLFQQTLGKWFQVHIIPIVSFTSSVAGSRFTLASGTLAFSHLIEGEHTESKPVLNGSEACDALAQVTSVIGWLIYIISSSSSAGAGHLHCKLTPTVRSPDGMPTPMSRPPSFRSPSRKLQTKTSLMYAQSSLFCCLEDCRWQWLTLNP